jgi:hypothetical protein
LAHGNENEHIEEVMNQKGIELRSLINKPLSDEDSNKFNQIIKNKDVERRGGTSRLGVSLETHAEIVSKAEVKVKL